jgi:hypothetical protein
VAVPAKHSFGLDDEDRFPPARPDAGNEHQQGPVSPGESKLPTAETATKDSDLVTQRDDLGLERRPRSKQVAEDPEEQSQHRRGAFLQAAATSMIAVRIGFLGGTRE